MLGRIYSEMIFKHGYVHSDPHPGNIFVRLTPDGNEEIILLDHGLYVVCFLTLKDFSFEKYLTSTEPEILKETFVVNKKICGL